MSKHGKTSFQEHWFNDPLLKDWILKKPNDVYSAGCRFCPQTISLCTMGRQSLISHMKGKKHKDKELAFNKSNMKHFLSKPTKPSDPKLSTEKGIDVTCGITSIDRPSTSTHVIDMAPQSRPTISGHCVSLKEKYILSDNVTSSEIKWCLQTVLTHKSFRSAEKDVKLFTDLFPDSEIAKKMQLSRAKMGYVVVFGLAPHFKEDLLKKVQQACDKNYPFVVGFDESLNKVAQRNQMDLNIRYWNSEVEEVSSRYLTSAFLGRARATDLLDAFLNSVQPLSAKSILQVSMDGPAVNYKFIQELQSFLLKEESNTNLLNVGSCGLHTLHNAFKCGMKETSWELSKFLRAIFNLFKDVPARRAIYTATTKSSLFPLKFCPVRWLQNGNVAQRAIEMLPHLERFVKDVSDNDRPTCASFVEVKSKLKDPLLSSKLAFFNTIASDIEPFLTFFQSDKPLAPFLYTKLQQTLCSIQERFVNPEHIGKLKTDLDKLENLLPISNVKVGFATKKEIKKCRSKLSDLDLKLFYKDCRNGLKKMVVKLVERSPLKFKLTKALTCWDPQIAGKEAGNQLLNDLLSILVESNWIDGHTADTASREFKSLIDTLNKVGALSSFDGQNDRLDNFWMKFLKTNSAVDTSSIKRVLILSLLISHGNANLERGFSVNKEVLIDNMGEETIVAQRVVYDFIQAMGGDISKINITKSMLNYVRCSRDRYHETLKRKREAKESEDENEKKRRRSKELIKMLEEKKAKLEEESVAARFALEKEIQEAYSNLNN